MRLSNQRPSRQRRGAVVVENAVVIAVFLLFIFGIIEFGRMVMVKNIVDNAAREGARYAVTHTAPVTMTVSGNTTTAGATTADVQAIVNARLSGVAGQLSNINIQVYASDSDGNPITDASGNPVTWTDSPFGEEIAVKVTADYKPILPSFLSLKTTFFMQGLSVMYSEAN